MQRVLVMRGGAIGDFILTLPALGALRCIFSQAVIEVMGNPRRAIFARHPTYADNITDLEQWDLYRLFSRRPSVSAALSEYLASFEVIISYLPAPDDTFPMNLRRYCSGKSISWMPHPPMDTHITEHLLQPVSHFSCQSFDPHPRVHVDSEAMETAERFWQSAGLPNEGVVALHPGSGGRHKLWPLAGWRQVMTWAARQGLPCLVIGGPAEQESVVTLLQDPHLPQWPCAGVMPLPHLAALLRRCQIVVGHDSGVTHLAAAVGTTTLALFGPTEPLMWGPRSDRACVLRPRSVGPLTLENLAPELVTQTLDALLHETFSFTPSRVACTILEVADGSVFS